jgi:hypothetical protein
VGHAARRRGRRGACLRDGLRHSRQAATRATNRKLAGTGDEAEPQTCVPPVSMAARGCHPILDGDVNFSASLHQWFPTALHRLPLSLLHGCRVRAVGRMQRKEASPSAWGSPPLAGARHGRRMTGSTFRLPRAPAASGPSVAQ